MGGHQAKRGIGSDLRRETRSGERSIPASARTPRPEMTKCETQPSSARPERQSRACRPRKDSPKPRLRQPSRASPLARRPPRHRHQSQAADTALSGAGKTAAAAAGLSRNKNDGESAEPSRWSRTSSLLCSASSGKTTVAETSGRGETLNVASVIRPSVPSEPQYSFGRSYPATFLTTLPPPLILSPRH